MLVDDQSVLGCSAMPGARCGGNSSSHNIHREVSKMVDDAKLHQFMGQMLSDLGGAASVALVRIGDALGLYKTLHERGPMTVPELAAAAGVNRRYLREW